MTPEYRNARSQDLECWYHDAGQFYLLQVDSFLKTGLLFGRRVLPYKVSELEVQDIDNETDWLLAEMKYQYMMERDRQKG